MATAWVQPSGAHDAYPQGAKVTHKGKTWESTTAGNVWEPGVSGWREIAAEPPPRPRLRDQALDAHEAATNTTLTAARQAVGAVVGDDNLDALEVVEQSRTDAFVLVVFTDGDLHLAARDRGDGFRVHLVADDRGWVERSGPLASLAELGAALSGGA